MAIGTPSKSFGKFEQVVDAALYRALPDDHLLALTDVAGSTRAIEAGNYKAVNMAGAAGISAIRNALAREEFPFVFGGDGASAAIAGHQQDVVREALARTARFVGDELGLDLRCALVPMRAVREAGHDVRVAWYSASQDVSYAMFSGGGLSWAEAQMKAGAFAIAPAPAGEYPDLTGLSCRWTPGASRHGVILSLVMKPAPLATPEAFSSAVLAILALAERLERQGHPIAAMGPPVRWPPKGAPLEIKARRREGGGWRTWLAVYGESLLAAILSLTHKSVGGFDPDRYRREVSINTDFRKFDDGLRMTLDCPVADADLIEAKLRDLRAAEMVRFGTFRQKEAILTCIVESPTDPNHMHFVDGAEGGYAAAAAQMKASG